MRNVYCLATRDIVISPWVEAVLFDVACVMLESKFERLVLYDFDLMGDVRTDFAERTIGSISGVEFCATIETNAGTGRVNYLVRRADVEVWREVMDVFSSAVHEALRAMGLRSSRRVPAFN
jgi:hypothetical protein